MRTAATLRLVFSMLVAAVLALLLPVAAPSPVGAAGLTAGAQPVENPITVENRHQGNRSWQIPWAGYTVADDTTMAVKGYASATSVRAGDAIGLHVRSQGSFTWTVYRLGYYQGLGGRWMASGTAARVNQPACTTNTNTGMVSCNWARTATVQTRSNWTSGVYVVVLTSGTYQNYITFVVRDDRPDAILALSPTNTYQAYNNFPDDGRMGKSLYPYNSRGALNTANGAVNAVTVSYDRPYARTGISDVLRDEGPMIQWAEARGFDMTYATDVDLHANPGLASAARSMWVPGHSEYWSDTMYEAVRTARAAGVGQSFLGANNLYWRVRMEPNAANTPNRLVTCWKADWAKDPIKTTGLQTGLFRNFGKPEQEVLGQMYGSPMGLTLGSHPWVVTAPNQWFYRGTGMAKGSKIAGIVGIETDFRHSAIPFPESEESYVLAQSPTVNRYDGPGIQEAALYEAPSGAWIFDAGTIQYTWGLGRAGVVDPRAQAMTTNLMARQSGFRSSVVSDRIGGSNRYETAAMISERTFEPGVPTVYLTTGLNFPDALSASAASRGVSPVLLVEPGGIPPIVADELSRLAPQSVTVLGAPATVDDAVLQEAEQLTGVPATRIAGSDRYATSALISAAAFEPGVPVVYVSTGLNFPDALAAGAAGAQAGGPVLLTRPTSLSAAALAEITRLRPARIVVTGATDAVSESVLTTLRGVAPTIRLAGPNRYATSRLIARDAQAAGGAETVAVTTGLNFPDALAGGPMVARHGGAIVLVQGALDPATAEEIVRNDPAQVFFLGTHPTVTNEVRTAAEALFDVVNGTVRPVIVDPKPPVPAGNKTLGPEEDELMIPEVYDREERAREELPWLSAPLD